MDGVAKELRSETGRREASWDFTGGHSFLAERVQ